MRADILKRNVLSVNIVIASSGLVSQILISAMGCNNALCGSRYGLFEFTVNHVPARENSPDICLRIPVYYYFTFFVRLYSYRPGQIRSGNVADFNKQSVELQ